MMYGDFNEEIKIYYLEEGFSSYLYAFKLTERWSYLKWNPFRIS